MSKFSNALMAQSARKTAKTYNDETLANWADELLMHCNNEHVSVDITSDELMDTYETDMLALGYKANSDGDLLDNMTEFEARKTGRAFVYEAMEHKGNKTKVIAAYTKAIRRRSKWLKTR